VGLIINGMGKGNAKAPSAAENAGILSPTVLDADTDLPIEGAVIVVAETGKAYLTGADGRAQSVYAPLVADEHFEDILPKDWSECTLLIYHENYIPAAVFGVQVSSAPREGPEILLFPISEAVTDSPATYVESPDKQWTRALLERFAPTK